MKAALYARVSSEEQIEGYSLDERVGYELPDYLARLRMSRQVHWQGPGFDHPAPIRSSKNGTTGTD